MVAPGESELTDGDVEQLRSLETAMWQTSTRADRDWMETHLAPDFTEYGRSGRRYTRGEILELEIGAIDVVMPLSGLSIRAIGPDAALVTYRSVEGRGHANRSSIWQRSRAADDGWLLEFHHGSPTDSS